MSAETLINGFRNQRNNFVTMLLNHCDEIAQLQSTVADQASEIETLKAKIAKLETPKADNELKERV